jgi:hypothetical protein
LLRHGAVVLLAGVGIAGTFAVVVSWSGADGAYFGAKHVGDRLRHLSLLGVVSSELKMLAVLAVRAGAPALFGAALGAVALLALRRRRVPPRAWSRATVGLLVFAACGCGLIGAFNYRPARYFYFALFPTVFIAVQLAGRLVGPRHWVSAALVLLATHAGTQLPSFAEWVRRRPLDSQRIMANDVVARIADAEPARETITVIGGLAAYVAFFDERIRPLAYKLNPNLPDVVARWRPRYVLAFSSDVEVLRERCPDLVVRLEPLASYRVMENYRLGQDQVLARVGYRE